MAKTKIAPAPTSREARSIPLGDVEISYVRDPHFIGEEGEQPVTIAGEELAAVLAWMARTAPGRPTTFAAPEYIARDLLGLGALCRLAVTSDQLGDDTDATAGIFAVLASILEDYATRINVTGEKADLVKGRITVRPTVAAKAAVA